MAKKEKQGSKLSLDDYDFGSEFDFDDFDLTPKPVKNKREAIERVAGSAFDAAKDVVKSGSFFRQIVKTALPRGYGNAIDMLDQGATKAAELYNEGSREVKPALKEVAKVIDRLMPAASKNVPKPVENLLKKFIDANKDVTSPTSEQTVDAANLAVAGLIGSTFKYNATQDARREAKEDARQGIQDAVGIQRHEASMHQLDGIRNAVVSMAAYQKRIEFGYQKKSLEIAARHYFVAVDSLIEQKKQNFRTTELLQGLLHNTSLPDVIKLKTSERFKNALSGKIFNNLSDGIFGGRNNFIGNLGNAFKEQAMGSIKNLAQGLRDGASGAHTALDGAQQASEMGLDRYHAIGALLGSEGAEWLGKFGATKFGKALGGSNSGAAKGIKKFGNKLRFGTENAAQIATDFSNSSVGGDEYLSRLLDKFGDRLSPTAKDRISGAGGKVLDPLLDLLRGTVQRANAQDTHVKEQGLEGLSEPAVFNNRAMKSLVEIIPGYLARILQEQQIARTGDQSVDLIQYDFAKGGFTSSKALRRSIFNNLFDKSAREGVSREKKNVIDLVDPNGVLNAEQRKELSEILMKDNLRGRAGYETGDIGNYQNDYNFGDSKHGEKYAKLFQELKSKDEKDLGNTRNEFASRFRQVGQSMNDRRGDIQQLLEIYPRHVLEDMGLLEAGSSQINMKQLQSYFGGERYKPKTLGGIRGGRSIAGPATPMLTAPNASAASADHTEDSPLLTELKRLIDITEEQNTKPLIGEIKDILTALQQSGVNLPGEQQPSAMSNFMTGAGEAARAAGGAAVRGGRRAKRRALVAARRFQQQNQHHFDAAQNRISGLVDDARVRMGQFQEDHQEDFDAFTDHASRAARRLQRRAKVGAKRAQQQAQEIWENRPAMEELREALTSRLEQLREGIKNGAARVRNSMARSSNDEVGGEHGSVLVDIKEILLDIKARLDDGILTTNMPADGILPRIKAGARNAAASGRGLINRLNMRISDVAKLGWKAGRKVAGIGASIGNSLVGNVFGAVGKIAGFAGDVATGVAGNTYRRARGFVDIYVGNERKPRLYGRLMQEGNAYFNKDTNKPVRHFKDITGTVVKRTAAGEEIVLEEDEIKDAWQREGLVKKSLKAAGVVVKAAGKLGNGIVGAVLGGIPPVFRMGLWGAKKAWGLLDMPQDVFVKDKLDDPALTARIMRAGGYTSAATGKTIMKPSQIDGPVLSGDEVVLTHDDIRKGLVDKNNKPLRTGLGKLLNMAFGGAKTALKLGMAAGKMVNKAVTGLFKNGLKLGGKLIKGGVKVGGGIFDILRGRNPFGGGSGEPATVEQMNASLQLHSQGNTILQAIFDILSERLVKPKKHSDEDADDDGIRDGSYADQMRKKKAAQDAINAKRNASKAGTVAAGAPVAGKKGEEEEEESNGLVDQLEADAIEGVGKRLWRGTKKLGGKLKKVGGKNLLKFGGKALGLAGAAYGAYSAYDNVKKGNYGEAALDAGLSVGGLAMTAGGVGALGTTLAGGAAAVGGIASTVGGGLLAAGGALAGLISAPVLLGAAAVAAVGIGAYYGYKYLTRKKLGLLSRIRYTQYGFLPSDNDHVGAVFGLEDKLKDAVIYGKEGASLDSKRVDMTTLFKDFDVSEDDKDAVNNWAAWFSNRFKPVFLTHVTGLKGVAGDKWLSDVDGLDPDVALKYIAATRFPEGPYGYSTSPFKDLKSLDAGSRDVKAIIDIAETELRKKAKDSPKGASTAGAALLTEVPAATPVAELNKDSPAAGITVPTSGIDPKILNQAAAYAAMAGVDLSNGKMSVAGSSTVLQSLGDNRLDGLDAIRFKTYGLVKMEADKIRALRSLEQSVSKDLLYSKNLASWNGALEQVLSDNAGSFGIDPSDESRATNWLNWFNMRFLPTYLNYASLIMASTGKNPEDGKSMLKPNQIVEVANGVFTSSGKSGTVWNISTSPWVDYELNSDVRSTDGNMAGLKETAKSVVLTEPGNKQAGNAPASKDGGDTKPDSAKSQGGFFSNIWQKASSIFTTPSNSGATSGPPVGGGAGTAGGLPSDFGGGREASKPGSGTGGMVDSIPKPTGNKTWSALKDTILSAAKMVGVDGKLMAAMAAIESGFDYTVKAGTSSATGLYQFITDTWNYMLKKYGSKYGIAPGTPPTDPRANALMGAEYVKDNMAALEGKLGRPLTDTDVYFAHFLGSGGAKKLLTADPNAIAAQLMPKEAKANQGIFYDKSGNPLTVGQVYQLVNNRVKNKAKSFGINDGGEAIEETKPTTAKTDAPPLDKPAGGGEASPSVAGTPPDTKAKPQSSSYGIGSQNSAAPPPVATDSSTPSGPTNNGVPIGAMVSGFAPPTAIQDRVASAQRQSQDMKVDFGATNEILTKQLEALLLINSAVQTIAGKAGQVSSVQVEAQPDSVTPSSPEVRAAPRRNAQMASMPVSVARPRAPY